MPKPSRPSNRKTSRLSHFDSSGQASMVDVSSKQPTRRTATASAFVELSAAVLAALPANPKGNPLEVARFAGIQAAKRTADLIPMCHPLALTHVEVQAAIVAGGVQHHLFRSHNWPDWRRNGSPHRCSRCCAHGLRHDQGARQSHRHSRHSPRIQIRRQEREFYAGRKTAELAEFAELGRVVGLGGRRIATCVVFTLDLRWPGPTCAAPRGSGEMANTPALGAGAQKACGFKSRLPHQIQNRNKRKTDRSRVQISDRFSCH